MFDKLLQNCLYITRDKNKYLNTIVSCINKNKRLQQLLTDSNDYKDNNGQWRYKDIKLEPRTLIE